MANLLGTTVDGSLLIGPSSAANAYSGAATGKLYFGNQVSDSPTHYHITTNLENYNGSGNYSKLDIRWYTGQRFYAHTGYGGFRFHEITTNAELFSVGKGDAHVRVENNLYVGNTIYNNGNAVIHAGNIGSQSVSYASSAGNADTLDGYHSNTVGNRHHTARGFTVGGDQNTYYPVTFGGSGAYAFNRYSIYRYYQWTAPWDPLGTGYHKGGLTFDFEWSGDIAWGGNDHTLRVIQLSEQYTSQVGGLALPVTQGVCVWLRGGTSYYEIQVDAYPVDAVVHLEGFTAGNGVFYGPREDNSNIQSEIYNRMPVRGSSELYDGGSRVITAGNIASQSVSYAVTSGTSSATTQTNFSELFIADAPVATKEYVTSQGYITGSYLPLTGGTLSGAVVVNLGNVNSDTVAFKVGGPSNYDSLTIGMEDTPDYDAFIASYGNDIRFYSGKNVGSENHSFYWFTSKAGTSQHSSVAMVLDHNQALSVTGVINASGGNSTNWNTAYGWGNHADYGYWNTDSVDANAVKSAEVVFAGNVTVEGTFTESSSIRFKENITPLDPALDKVNQLEAVSYNKIGVDDREIGLIAEDVVELFPEVVTYNEEGQPQGIQYQRLSVILLKAVQELTERVNKLENK